MGAADAAIEAGLIELGLASDPDLAVSSAAPVDERHGYREKGAAGMTGINLRTVGCRQRSAR